jgi:hypothetical protein
MIPDHPYLSEMVEVDKTVNDYLQFSHCDFEGDFEGEFAVVSDMWTLTQRDFNRMTGIMSTTWDAFTGVREF